MLQQLGITLNPETGLHEQVSKMTLHVPSIQDAKARSWFGQGITYTYDVETTVSTGYKFVSTLLYKPKGLKAGRGTHLMASFDALGLGDFGSMAWELIPFSFIIDYIADIDKWVSHMTDVDLLPLEFTKVRAGYSVKACSRVTTKVTSHQTGETWSESGVIDYYTRKRIPNPSPNWREWAGWATTPSVEVDAKVSKHRAKILWDVMSGLLTK
jgi:hypothetical protein